VSTVRRLSTVNLRRPFSTLISKFSQQDRNDISTHDMAIERQVAITLLAVKTLLQEYNQDTAN